MWRPALLWTLAALATCQALVLADDPSYTSAAYRQMACQVDEVVTPTSTADVAKALSSYYEVSKSGKAKVKVRATHRWFHSTASFPCPGQFQLLTADGDDPSTTTSSNSSSSSSSRDLSVHVLLDDMNNVLAFDANTSRITIQAGMTVGKFLEAATSVNRSCPFGAVPAFAGLTLGGALVTNAHGTGHKSVSTLCDIVVELVWVDGTGRVRRSARSSPEGQALCGGLGIVGIITELTIALTAPSHTSTKAAHSVSDAALSNDIRRMLRKAPHTLVVWRPDLKKYTAFTYEETPLSTPTTGATAAIELPKDVVELLSQALTAWQKDVVTRNPVLETIIGVAVRQMSLDHAWATGPDGPVWDAVGPTNQMLAVGCGQQCAWEAGANLTFDDIHFTIELEQLPNWIADVKRVMERDFWDIPGRRGRLLPPGYFWLRFGNSNDDLIGPNSGLKAPAHVQMSFMKSDAAAGVPGKYAWVLEAIEQLTVCKYDGRPHWGKNTERTYTNRACPIRTRYPKFDQLLTAQAQFDPLKMFEPALFARLAAGDVPVKTPLCVLKGQCYCSQDSHCAPDYQCVPSAAFREYKVCKPARR